jgi:hypothetical protein
MINEIIIVKLVNGENYIGVLAEEDDQGIRIDNVLRIIAMYSQGSTNYNVGILPWCDFSKKNDVYFDKSHILYSTLPSDDILKFYNNYSQKSQSTKEPAQEDEYSYDDETFIAAIERFTSNNTIH